MSTVNAAKVMNRLESGVLGMPLRRAHRLLPGLVLAVCVAWLSIGVGRFVGVTVLGLKKSPVSPVMVAILLGLVVTNVIRLPAAVQPGLTFSVKKLLRLGIIMLGIRLSVFDVFRLGALGVPVVLLCVVGAFFITTRLSKILKLPERLGALIAVGTSICGVSAIVSTGPTVKAKEEEIAYAVAVITVFGTIATIAYPYLTHLLFAEDALKAGLFLGTAIHDTSQVAGASLVFSDLYSLPRALEVATVTKLVRNVFMVAVIPFMAFRYTREQANGDPAVGVNIRAILPLFVIGFLATAVLRSVGDAGINAGSSAFGLWNSDSWTSIYSAIQRGAVNLLVVALAGVGLSTRIDMLRGLGMKPFIVGLAAALTVGALSLAAISLADRFIPFLV